MRASRDMDDLAATSPRVVAAIVELVYGELARDPRRVGKPLRFELEGLYSARRSEYRVIYLIEDVVEVVRIERIGPRREIYRPT
ncbi:MAG: type II toxin-antitoxin system RelE family toxin [Acidimicrobiales bacterium]